MIKASFAPGLAVLALCASAWAGGPLIEKPSEAVRAQPGASNAGLVDVANAGGLGLAWPLCAALHSGFGYRIDPMTGTVAFHTGLDIGDAFGLKVHAAHKGQVVAAERRGPYGLMIEIRNPNGYGTRYAQLRATFVKPGDEVETGQVIAEVGSSGRSLSPHLHFEVWNHDRVQDPLGSLTPSKACPPRQ